HWSPTRLYLHTTPSAHASQASLPLLNCRDSESAEIYPLSLPDALPILDGVLVVDCHAHIGRALNRPTHDPGAGSSVGRLSARPTRAREPVWTPDTGPARMAACACKKTNVATSPSMRSCPPRRPPALSSA